jgi:hypothetical protein
MLTVAPMLNNAQHWSNPRLERSSSHPCRLANSVQDCRWLLATPEHIGSGGQLMRPTVRYCRYEMAPARFQIIIRNISGFVADENVQRVFAAWLC